MAAPVLAPKLHRIRIEKFRRIRDVLELDLRTPRGRPTSLAVLAGPNGCGKTSVLEAVLLGLGQDKLVVRELDEPDHEESWRTSLSEGARIELTISRDDGPEETWVRTRHGLLLDEKSDNREAFVGLLPDVQPDLLVEYFSSWRAPKLVGAVKPLRTSRDMKSSETLRLSRLKQRIADEYMRSGFQRSVRGSASSNTETWLELLNRAWRRFHRNDGTEIVPDLVEREGEGDFLDLFVQKGNDRICSVDQLSSGEIEILVFAQWVILNDVRAGLLLIDEPELHLHPSWQATILPALHELAPEVQILAATHSDAVWDQASEHFLLVDESDPRSQAWRKAHALPGDDEAAS